MSYVSIQNGIGAVNGKRENPLTNIKRECGQRRIQPEGPVRPPVSMNTPCLRVSVVSKSRRGQTLILALAILFLLVTLGGIFVTLLLRNLARVARQSDTDASLTLALAGLQYAGQ